MIRSTPIIAQQYMYRDSTRRPSLRDMHTHTQRYVAYQCPALHRQADPSSPDLGVERGEQPLRLTHEDDLPHVRREEDLRRGRRRRASRTERRWERGRTGAAPRARSVAGQECHIGRALPGAG